MFVHGGLYVFVHVRGAFLHWSAYVLVMATAIVIELQVLSLSKWNGTCEIMNQGGPHFNFRGTLFQPYGSEVRGTP